MTCFIWVWCYYILLIKLSTNGFWVWQTVSRVFKCDQHGVEVAHQPQHSAIFTTCAHTTWKMIYWQRIRNEILIRIRCLSCKVITTEHTYWRMLTYSCLTASQAKWLHTSHLHGWSVSIAQERSGGELCIRKKRLSDKFTSSQQK
jgi:hypothetical protein